MHERDHVIGVRRTGLLRYIVVMTAHAKLLNRVLRGTSDKHIEFDSLCDLLRRFGFVERVHGDHHIFTRDGVSEILNLQPKGHHAKAYQVKQVRNVIIQYKLAGETDAK